MRLKPSVGQLVVPLLPSTALKPLYTVVKLYNVQLFERCAALSATDWVHAEDSANLRYPIHRLDSTRELLSCHPVILNPDGSIWREGSLYILDQALADDTCDPATLIAQAGHLADFMNTLLEENRDFLDFTGYRFELPTYIYKEKYNLPIKKQQISASTANVKIRTVVRFYTDLIDHRGFSPQKQPWKVKRIKIIYEDVYGYERSKYVSYTDLTYPIAHQENTGEYINDGGKLIPLIKSEQLVLLTSLMQIGNPEMILVFTIALVTGMRIQTILTLRVGSIKSGDSTSFDLIPIRAGRGTLVDTKRNKPIVVLMPSWLHHKLTVYLNSDRYKQRAILAPAKPENEQYVFVSRTGKPYYIAKNDIGYFSSDEKGSYIRLFIKSKLKPLMGQKGVDVNFSFHDLRATFGMNLIHERLELLRRGRINEIELIDYVRKRMSHSTSKTTQGYLQYERNNDLAFQADTEYQQFLIDLLATKD
ncbi:site-specific integrase [Pseudomonas sp.]|uniref:site-specific integrase n=1 Tax=Pseudomonas sp. TaxID=306 RepID=UPI0032657F23